MNPRLVHLAAALTLVLTVSAGQDVSATRGAYGESRSCVPSGGYCGSTRSNGSQCCEYDQTCQFDGKYLHICRGKSPHDTVTATTTTTPTEIAKAPPSSTREASCVRSGDACNRNSRCCDYWQECRKSGPHLYVCKGDSGPHSDSTARTLASVARHVRRTSSSRTRTKATVMARRPPSNLLTATATANTTATRTGRASASPTSGRPSVCGGLGVITRKDIKQMTQQEWDDYVDAHRRLRATNSNVVLNGFTLNLYEAFSHVHVRDALHRQALFGLWHRLMLWEWDKALNRVKPGVVQPYFDWSVSASDLFADPMFDDDRFGGKGGTGGGSGSPIPTTSLFAGMVSLIDEHNPNPTSRHLVRQNYDSGLTLRGRSYFDGLVTTELGFGKFRIALELAHNTFHRSIGGDMVWKHSPNSVLFYAHHAFVDKTYREWERASAANKFTPDGLLDTVLQPWGLTARQVLDSITPCVRYGESAGAFPRESASTTSLLAEGVGGVKSPADEEEKARKDEARAATLFGASQADIEASNAVADDILRRQGKSSPHGVAA